MADTINFRNYGTFTGPNDEDFDFDDSEPNWWKNVPLETLAFTNTDIGVLFYQSRGRYAWFHANGTDVDNIILESNVGPLSSLLANVNQTFFNGDVTLNGSVFAQGSITCGGPIFCNSSVSVAGIGPLASAFNVLRARISSKKSFDIPHPTKKDHRLRYICLEGPEAEVYYRGKLKDSNIIEMPDYWKDLVDVETIGVSLTPIGCYQELFVDRIEWGSRIIIKNNASGPINCSYVVYGERKDVSKNISEYKGLTPDDYPGDNNEYSINGR